MSDPQIDVPAELAALREQVYAARGTPSPGRVEVSDAPPGVADPLEEHARLREHVFESRVPLVGELVARLRRLWNDAATTWYVRPLIAQQSTFNALVVERLRELDERLAETDRELALVLREVAALRETVARLQAGVER